MTEQPRDAITRKADTLAKLQASAADAFVASSGPDGAYLVPLSLAWVGERVVLALESTSRTARNLTATGGTRLALGGTRDVVMIDATLESAHPVAEAPAPVAEGYATQADWNPREAGETYVYLVLRPTRIQAWREADELAGRTLMKHSTWLV